MAGAAGARSGARGPGRQKNCCPVSRLDRCSIRQNPGGIRIGYALKLIEDQALHGETRVPETAPAGCARGY